jgi:hypothetical protein
MTSMRKLGALGALLTVSLLASVATAKADDDRRSAIDTKADYTPLREFTQLASSSTCPGEGSGRQAEPTGIYFLLAGTQKYTSSPTSAVKAYDERTVNDETLLVNRQHSGETTTVDQAVAITPVDSSDD